MSKSNIGWTDHTLNFYSWNCNPVSPGCFNCYAMAWAERQGKVFKGAPTWRGDKALAELRKIPSGERAFVNSFSDTWHHKAPDEWIHQIFDAAATRPDVILMLLTKRIERAAQMAADLTWHPNIWIGTSVENADYVGRIEHLRAIPTPNRFISFEPLIGSVGQVNLQGVAWVITGGESGANRRYFDKRWAADIVKQAGALGIPRFHKQGSAFKPGEDRILGGRTFDEFPASWQVMAQPQTAPEQGVLL